MESGPSSDDTEFRVPGEPAPVLGRERQRTGKGGKRRGSGRKRVHEEGYESVRSQLWKNISVHATVYEEWTEQRNKLKFTNHTEFARFLLENLTKQGQGGQTTPRARARRQDEDPDTVGETLTRFVTY